MEVMTGALSSVITKLGHLLIGEYNLQKRVKGEIKFLQDELKSMKGAMEKISNTAPEQLDIQDKIWARDLRELSYDIEDSIDTSMVQGDGKESGDLQGIRKFIDRSANLFRKAKIRHWISTNIRDIKKRVVEVHERRRRYDVSLGVDQTIATTVDPRLFAQYREVKDLVGIDETRKELINIMMEENGVTKQQGQVVSIFGFGGLGKTTLAKQVYEKIRALFDCCAFVSVSQTPDLKKVFKGILYQLDKKKYDCINEKPLDEEQLISEIHDFLQQKRYFIVVDDIWDISVWKMIRCALPYNSMGYIIIATTRISTVAKQVGRVYELKPLSLNNSRKLLYRRIFGNENEENKEEETVKCPSEELAEVSDRILKKCAGVPLAIITMASMLAYKPRTKMDWYTVYSSIGIGLENNLDVGNMRKILSFSYYDLPSHLRTCLLYLSMFPEDYEIGKDRLIWMWITEGFIQCKEQGQSLFQVGECYFNELINRCMIQPVYDEHYGMLEHCRVHDMVLDLIRSFSKEENFVTILNGMDHASASNTVRRLSLQYGNEDRAMPWAASRSVQQVRSIVVFQFAVDLSPAFQRMGVLRVLHLQGCDLSQCCSLKYLGYLIHLRYLGLINTRIDEVPKEVGNLQYLQTLDVTESGVSCLPGTIVHLKKLMCLRVHWFTRVPGIGSLTSLEELTWLRIDENSTDAIEELGVLAELRVLRIAVFTEWNDKLAECLRRLKKIVVISVIIGHCSIRGFDDWVAPRRLRRLETRWGCWFSTLPAWLNPSLLLDLSFLSIDVRVIRQNDLETLGRLPALYYLDLQVDHQKNVIMDQRFVVRAHLFPCLVRCSLWGFLRPVVFERGAMSMLTRLEFTLSVRVTREMADGNGGGLELGLGYLASLQDVCVCLRSEGASVEEVDQAKAALWQAAEIHPNNPTIHIDQDEDSDDD